MNSPFARDTTSNCNVFRSFPEVVANFQLSSLSGLRFNPLWNVPLLLCALALPCQATHITLIPGRLGADGAYHNNRSSAWLSPRYHDSGRAIRRA